MLRRAQPLGRRFHESFITLRPSALLQRRAPFLASYCPACPLTRPHTLPRRRHYSKRAQHQKSGIGFWTVGIVAAVSIGGALFVAAIRSPQETDQDALKALLPARFAHQSKTDSDSDPDSYLTMAPTTLPGRPGNLTPEQENTLREFWAIFMRVFNGDIASEEENGAATNGHNEADAAAPADGKKDKKKSRLGMFKRNKGEQEEKPATASTSWSSFDVGKLKLAADDDKFGQTAAYKSALANIPPEELRRAFWGMVKHDHPDALLLRFLRARKWDIEKALIMAISAMQWRLKEVQVDEDIMKNGELGALETSMSDSKGKKDAEDFMTQMRMGKSFLHGLDVEGRPICYVRARLHKAGDQSEETIERFTVYTIETARMLLRAPVDTATVIFDLTDFSMANMDYTPVNFMIRCFEANYPESLGTVLVYRAPWIFNAIWAVVKGWLDPVVASKVHFPKNAQELSNFIPKSQIPTELGGEEQWEYKYVEPVPGENDKMKEEAPRKELQTERQCIIDKYETSIIEWVRAGESVSQDDRRKERDALAEQLRQNYWKLDPYVRARSLYDRTGVIKPGGVLDFYPEASH